MDYFWAIYCILYFLQCTTRCIEFPGNDFTLEHFKVADTEFAASLEMLIKRGYIDGVDVKRSFDGMIEVSLSTPRITLSGLEYLHGNDFMLKAAERTKGYSG